MKIDTLPVVEVVWVDAEEKGDIGWNDLKEMIRYAKKPCPTMHTVGYEVYRSDSHVAILSTIGDVECSTLEKIPTGFIVSHTILRAPTKKSTPPAKTKSSK